MTERSNFNDYTRVAADAFHEQQSRTTTSSEITPPPTTALKEHISHLEQRLQLIEAQQKQEEELRHSQGSFLSTSRMRITSWSEQIWPTMSLSSHSSPLTGKNQSRDKMELQPRTRRQSRTRVWTMVSLCLAISAVSWVACAFMVEMRLSSLVTAGAQQDLAAAASYLFLAPPPTQGTERPKRSTQTIPLDELVDTQPETSCPPGLVLIEDIKHIDPAIAKDLKPRKIPRIIHMTAKSRCVTPEIAQAIAAWKVYPDHKFYFHNDAAMNRLLYDKEWPEFPNLRFVLLCTNQMVQVADLWRALMLWEYGGIYTDFDNTPKKFNPSTSLKSFDEAYFEIEKEKMLSQYFMVSERHHPLFYLVIMKIWENIFALLDVGDQYAPKLTGPGALKMAMRTFMKMQRMPVDTIRPWKVFHQVHAGRYVGLDNRTVTVVPWTHAINRDVISDKEKTYQAMNMTHFQSMELKHSEEACHYRLYLDSFKQLQQQQEQWGQQEQVQ